MPACILDQDESNKQGGKKVFTLLIVTFWFLVTSPFHSSSTRGNIRFLVPSVIVWVRLESLLPASSVSSSGRWLTRANTRPVAALFPVGKSPGNCQQTAEIHTHTNAQLQHFLKHTHTHTEGCLQLVSIHFFLRRIVGLWSSLSPLCRVFLSQPAMWQLLLVRWTALSLGRRKVINDLKRIQKVRRKKKEKKKLFGVWKYSFICSPTCSAPLCSPYVINLSSSVQAGAQWS